MDTFARTRCTTEALTSIDVLLDTMLNKTLCSDHLTGNRAQVAGPVPSLLKREQCRARSACRLP